MIHGSLSSPCALLVAVFLCTFLCLIQRGKRPLSPNLRARTESRRGGMLHTAAFYFIEFNTALTTSLVVASLAYVIKGLVS